MARTHELSIALNDVALLRQTKQIVNGDRPGPLHLRGMWLSEITVVVSYDTDEDGCAGYDVVAVETDTEQRRQNAPKWDISRNTIAITDGCLFDAVKAAVAADHDDWIRAMIDDDIRDRADEAAETRAKYRAELRRDAA